MNKKHVRLILNLEVAITDPVAAVAMDLSLRTDPVTGAVSASNWEPSQAENAVGAVAMRAAFEALREMQGVEMISGSALPWPANEDGSYRELTIPRFPSRAEWEQIMREQKPDEE